LKVKTIDEASCGIAFRPAIARDEDEERFLTSQTSFGMTTKA